MSILVYTYFEFDRKLSVLEADLIPNVTSAKIFLLNKEKIPPVQCRIVRNGKYLGDNELIHKDDILHAAPAILGGKGGFGSMLRAIGAQIEKTTNREACRDLSGRRLRDINEEERLKKWLAKKEENKREAAKRKREKLESLLKEPKHEFNDPEFFKNLSETEEYVSTALEEGLLKLKESSKRKADDPSPEEKPKKKLNLMLGFDIDSSEDSDSNSDEDKIEPKQSEDKDSKTESDSTSCDSQNMDNLPSVSKEN